MNLERDDERVLAAQIERAETEAQRILHAALEQAAVLQVEMSREVEVETERRLATADREIAERLAAADREANERIRQSVDTAAALLLNAHREADRVREDRASATVPVDERRQEPVTEPAQVDALLDEAQQAAMARVSEADAFAEQRIAEATEWCRQHLEEADRIGAQRLLDAEIRAREIIDEARVQAAALLSTSTRVEPSEDARGRTPWPAAPSDLPPPPTPTVSEPGASSEGRRRHPRLAKTFRVVLLVVVTVMGTDLLRSCIAEPYTVASTSMEPEFHDGDRLVVNKLAYRFGDVGRGDVVVLDAGRVAGGESDQSGATLVKRVIGLPGEVVQSVDGQLLIDGEPIDEPWLADVETAAFGPVQLDESSLYVLGDNRELSIDSRAFGPVPTDAVVGRVEVVIWPPGHAGGV